MNKLNIDDFIIHFKDKDVFEMKDIVDFYRSADEQIKSATVNWRIYSLVQKGVLQRVGRGKFRLGNSKIFIPEISPKLKSLYNKIHKEFPFTAVCVWHTSVFNEFMQHQMGKFYYMIEVEKESAEAVFYVLKEQNLAVFLNPNQDILNKYLPENKMIYIVKSLVSEAPIQKVKRVCTLSIEKMLVDIFCDETLFAAQQGAEMRTVFNEVLSKYTVNQSKMLRYANRRKKKTSFENYLKTVTNNRQQN
ncbi:hypothetical protein FACS189426_16110 [Bacteroidia bacterium]|nr:hypothetical protein FACS189426_16110 [Bacteroidia bacterium]